MELLKLGANLGGDSRGAIQTMVAGVKGIFHGILHGCSLGPEVGPGYGFMVHLLGDAISSL